MMRGVSTWAVAVRKPLPEQLEEGGLETDEIPLGEIEVADHPLTSVLKTHRLLRLPIIRGVVALGESLAIGFKALGISANAQLPEDEKEISGGVWAGHGRRRAGARDRPVLRRPGRADEPDQGPAATRRSCSGSSRACCAPRSSSATCWLLSRLRDLRRVFEYHGAEHKTISCYEADLELTPENAQRFSPPAPALRHELPARRDDRRDLRLRPDRPARLVLAGR